MQSYIEPPYVEWLRCVEGNRGLLARQRDVLARFDPDAIRRQLLEEARSHTASLGLDSPPELISEAVREAAPIVMAGHQPVVYHPGILFKNDRLSQLSRECGGVGINVVIDTDEGDAGRMVWPRREGEQLVLHEGSFSTGRGLYREQRVADSATVQRVFARMIDDLNYSGLLDAAHRSVRVAELYVSMEGEPVVVANSRVRAHFEERRYLEVPLSRILRIPEVQGWMREILEGYASFAPLYNSVLREFRRVHKIKNAANPFPDLRVTDEGIEMPFWKITHHGEREAVVFSLGDTINSMTTQEIVPRGSMVTFLLRSLCSDLFIHGRGGGTYDPFVDELSRSYMQLELPRFVVASCTEYLFPDMVERYARAVRVKEQYKEFVSHTERQIGTGVFTAEEDVALRELVTPRSDLLVRLQQAQSPEQRSAVAHEVNALNRRVREFIDKSSLAPALKDAEVEEGGRSRWSFREYPAWMVKALVVSNGSEVSGLGSSVCC